MPLPGTKNNKQEQIDYTQRRWYEVFICTVGQLGNLYRLSWCQTWTDWLLFFPVAWIAADFISGLYHWFADSYRSHNAIINAIFFDNFQLHHEQPLLICKRHICNVNWEVNMPSVLLTMYFILTISAPSHFMLYLSSVGVWVSLVNQAHRWAHDMPANVPKLVQLLQCMGLFISPQSHRRHHSTNHLQDYCIVNGVCNPVLNRLQFWRNLEYLVYLLFGAESYAMLFQDKQRFNKSPFATQALKY